MFYERVQDTLIVMVESCKNTLVKKSSVVNACIQDITSEDLCNLVKFHRGQQIRSQTSWVSHWL